MTEQEKQDLDAAMDESSEFTEEFWEAAYTLRRDFDKLDELAEMVRRA